MNRAIVSRAREPLRGTLHLPGDKSISHRRALMSLFVNDDVILSNFGTGDDCRTTLECLSRLGKRVAVENHQVTISGPAGCLSTELDCGNSGTTARLLMGVLAGHEGEWTLHGDSSLSRRPMERVAEPLHRMGARIDLTDGHLPAMITGRPLAGIDYDSPVASAQVKSAVLLAGLKARGVTRYREPILTRDHTERLLGIGVDYVDWLSVDPKRNLVEAERLSGHIPSDPSTASFWIVAALMVRDSYVTFPRLLSNPHRLALADLLSEHGVRVKVTERASVGCEESATLEVQFSFPAAMTVKQTQAAKLIDEIPVLAALTTQLPGTSVFGDASELRVKESDRLALLCENLRRMGASLEERPDGMVVSGPSQLRGAEIETNGDHRIAMAFAVAGLAAEGETIIRDADCVSVSYPEFWRDLQKLAPGTVDFE